MLKSIVAVTLTHEPIHMVVNVKLIESLRLYDIDTEEKYYILRMASGQEHIVTDVCYREICHYMQVV